MTHSVAGQHRLLEEQQPGTAAEVPGLPTEIDVATTAEYTRQVLAGRPAGAPELARQVEHILQLAAQIS